MARLFDITLIATAFVVSLSGGVAAQQLTLFESKSDLDATISQYMAKGQFSTLAEEVSPPARMSTSRLRILEDAYADDLPMPTNFVPLFQNEAAEGVSRRVEAWWDGDAYVYLGLLTHERPDDLAVLDFLITNDVQRATRWYLTGAIK